MPFPHNFHSMILKASTEQFLKFRPGVPPTAPSTGETYHYENILVNNEPKAMPFSHITHPLCYRL